MEALTLGVIVNLRPKKRKINSKNGTPIFSKRRACTRLSLGLTLLSQKKLQSLEK